MPEGLILGINGSPHKKGMGVNLMESALLRCREEGFETELLHLRDQKMRFYHGEYTARTPQGAGRLFRLVSKAEGIIFSTPTHWFGPSDLMKCCLSHLTVFSFRKGGYALLGKVAGFIATCEEDGGQASINAMAAPLVHMGFLIPPQTMLFYNINMAAKSHDKWMIHDAPYVGLNVARLVRLVRGQEWGYG